MKSLKSILTALIFIICSFSCTNEPINETTSSLNASLETNLSKTVTVPFKADFYTKRDYSITPDCTASSGDGYDAPNYQTGAGNATHLGGFTTTISFCVNNATFQYVNGKGVFIASNGDELYYNIPATGDIGQIFPVEDPYYELRFLDSFEFTGGTGRFEGASGGGFTDSWVNLFDDEGNFIPEHQTDHFFSGELILHPGSRSND